jgi:hypothetical protein
MVPVSVGELFDKITILEIKQKFLTDQNKLDNVKKELDLLLSISSSIDQSSIKENISQLKDVNTSLWHIEESKRDKERQKVFDAEFIKLARSVYIQNDQRAEIKKQINILTNSTIIEEKSYSNYI